MPKSGYEKWSDDELQQENYRLMAERSAIGEKQDEIRVVLNARVAETRAAQVLEGLTPGQRDVLIAAATAQIEMEGKVV